MKLQLYDNNQLKRYMQVRPRDKGPRRVGLPMKILPWALIVLVSGTSPSPHAPLANPPGGGFLKIISVGIPTHAGMKTSF